MLLYTFCYDSLVLLTVVVMACVCRIPVFADILQYIGNDIILFYVGWVQRRGRGKKMCHPNDPSRSVTSAKQYCVIALHKYNII